MKLQVPTYLKLTAYVILFIAAIWLMAVAKSILVPLAIGGFLSMILYPVCKKMEMWGIPRILAIVISLFIIIILLGIIIFFITSQFMRFLEDLPDLTNKLQRLIDDAQKWLEENVAIPGNTSSVQWVQQRLMEMSSTGATFVTDTVSTATNLLITIGLIPVYIFLFLLYRTQFKNFLFKISAEKRHPKVRAIITKIHAVIRSYVTGLFTVILIVAVLNSVGLMILGIEYALFFGCTAALLTIIPYIGVFIGSAIPVLIALLTKDSLWYPVGVAGLFMVVQFLEGNFITPKIVGSKVSLNPLAAILALFVGGKIWGAAGMILFIPLVAVLKVFFDSFEPLRPFGYLLSNVPDEAHDYAGQSLNRKMLARLSSINKKSAGEEDDEGS